MNVLVLPPKQPRDRSEQPLLLLINAVGLAEILDFNDRHEEIMTGDRGQGTGDRSRSSYSYSYSYSCSYSSLFRGEDE